MDSFLSELKRKHEATAQESAIALPNADETIENLTSDSSENLQVQTVYEGDYLKKIIIHCECGKEIILSCQYKNN